MKRSLLLKSYFFFTRNTDFLFKKLISYRVKKGKEDPIRLSERMGVPSASRPANKLIWFHTASVGELLSICELISYVGKKDKTVEFLITSGSRTSAEIIATRMPKRCRHQYVPIDTLKATKAFLDHWKPDLAIWVESEFWPRLLLETKARGVPIGLVNARLSKKSFDRWKIFKNSAYNLLKVFDFIFVQDEATLRYIQVLGSNNLNIKGIFSLKEEARELPFNSAIFKKLANMVSNRNTWVAASTHYGEEEIVADCHKMLRSLDPKVLLILVPRHPDRWLEIKKLLVKKGFEVAVRSNNDEINDDTQIYLANTVGELGLWYRITNKCFIGGSIVKIGGHNPFEAIVLNTAIVHGPNTYNFKEIYGKLNKNSASIVVNNSEELFFALKDLMLTEKATNLASRALKITHVRNGFTEKVAKEILAYL